MRAAIGIVSAAVGLLIGLAGQTAWANGGPFVVKYPGGDPAAKGVLARLDPGLKPARESRLRVVHEDLTIRFHPQRFPDSGTPLVEVTAAYTIENPTGDEVQVDFGFPILRGIYMNPLSMMPRPDVQVTVNGKGVAVGVLSNSMIYGMIRAQARETIEKGIAGDEKLADLVAAVRRAAGTAVASPAVPTSQQAGLPPRPAGASELVKARQALREHLAGIVKWDRRDAALLAEYAGLDLGPMRVNPFDRPFVGLLRGPEKELNQMMSSNLGVLSAIGEQKATQFLARLASRFDPQAAPAYEALFASWGGDVRERAVDLDSGQLRPREYDAKRAAATLAEDLRRFGAAGDPTVFARVDYLDPRAKLGDVERASCLAVLENLPVVFTFAPMNLLHYQVKFPAGAKQVVTVSYRQYAFVDTREPATYQIAYVLHPATLWDDFGPIRLKVGLPKGIACRASVPLEKEGTLAPASSQLDPLLGPSGEKPEMEGHSATLTRHSQKSGELYVAIDKAAWDARFKRPAKAAGK